MKLLLVILCSLLIQKNENPEFTPALDTIGNWGTNKMTISISLKRIKINYECAHGEINEPLVLDKNGTFNVVGTHIQESGKDLGKGEVSEPVRYQGEFKNNELKISVTNVNTGELIISTTLQKNPNKHVLKCP